MQRQSSYPEEVYDQSHSAMERAGETNRSHSQRQHMAVFVRARPEYDTEQALVGVDERRQTRVQQGSPDAVDFGAVQVAAKGIRSRLRAHMAFMSSSMARAASGPSLAARRSSNGLAC